VRCRQILIILIYLPELKEVLELEKEIMIKVIMDTIEDHYREYDIRSNYTEKEELAYSIYNSISNILQGNI